MRRTSKAATAGSTKRLGKSKPALLACLLAACVAALTLVVGSASGATTRFLVEAFGSSAQPTFPEDRGIAVDQATGEVYVLETSTDEIRRYNADGTPSNFGALGSNAIDGEGAGDAIPEGSLAFPFGRSESQIAIDESGGATDGNVYVTESARDQVSIFSSTGAYLGELSAHSGGAFNEPIGVAVDPSGNVYVGDSSASDLIHKYEPAANPPVNADNTASFNSLAGTSSIGTLAAGAEATAGFIFVNRLNGELFKLDSATGEVKYQITTGASTVSVDSTTGHVFVPRLTGTGSEVVEYDASGATEATLVSAFKPGSTAEGVAVKGSTEEVYVARSGTQNVEVFGPAAVIPDVVTSPPSSNTGVRATLAGTVNPDGVELDECFFEWGEGSFSAPYTQTTPCAQTPAAIGAGTSPVAVSADISGLKPQGTAYHYRLVAVNPNATISGANQNFNTASTVAATAASSVTSTGATLQGTVNPDGAVISECVFEWGPEKDPSELFQKFPETSPCVPGPGGIGSGTSPVAVAANVTGLEIGTVYVYRLKVSYPTKAVTTVSTSLQTLGPVIGGTWSEDVGRSGALLKAEVNPVGKATTYRFEWGTEATYGNQTADLPVGSDSSDHELTHLLTGLAPGTEYHFRVVAVNADAEHAGPDTRLITYERPAPETDCPNQAVRYGRSAALPDCRAYEMVSPVDKAGGDVLPPYNFEGNLLGGWHKSTSEGARVTYSAPRAFGDAVSAGQHNQYIATRGAAGWSSHGINAPQGTTLADPDFGPDDLRTTFRGFTSDLTSAWALDFSRDPLVPGGREDVINLYRRDNASDSYEALTPFPALTGTEDYLPGSVAYSDDGEKTFYTAERPLTTDAAANTNSQVYELTNGQLELISILPGGGPDPEHSVLGSSKLPRLTGTTRESVLDGAVSNDGTRVFWTSGITSFDSEGRIYVRVDGERTVAVSESVTGEPSRFLGADRQGERAIFRTKNGRLYVFEIDTETPTLIAHGVNGVAGTSDDLSYIYFGSTESLAPGAIAGENNLYLYRDGTYTFIAKPDGPELKSYALFATAPLLHAPRVTPDGRHLIFMSPWDLTGYDNVDPETGNRAIEVFRYAAAADELRCVSCNPSGARPHGAVIDESFEKWDVPHGPNAAAWIPTWEWPVNELRPMSEDGSRIFFNAIDSLVLEDTNGVQDVYQWEEPGSGSCDHGDPQYSVVNGGCVSLISTGQSPAVSEFREADADGSDVFFATESSIDPEDPGLYDLYDARAGGGYPRPTPPTPCVGDACQSVPPPPDDPTPASAGFRGRGDLKAQRDCGTAAKRASGLRHRAKRVRRQGNKRRAARLSKRAKRMSRSAARCRKANRRAGR